MLLLIIIIAGIAGNASANGLPVGKYLEDPTHKDEIISFYLNSVFTGINLVNNRLEKKIFCMGSAEYSAFEMIDRKISKLRTNKRLSDDMTVDEIMLDILIEEYPCKSSAK